MSSSAICGSASSPLRTPRERAWPRPTTLSEPSALNSPTTAQTLDVPISRPTMIDEAGSNMFLLVAERLREFGRRGRLRTGGDVAHRDAVGHGEIKARDAFAGALSHIVDGVPAAHLPVHVAQAKGDICTLPCRR